MYVRQLGARLQDLPQGLSPDRVNPRPVIGLLACTVHNPGRFQHTIMERSNSVSEVRCCSDIVGSNSSRIKGSR